MTTEYAAPSRNLKKLWYEWIELHRALDEEMPNTLAAPFFSAVSARRCKRRILLVGKATKGDWGVAAYRGSPRSNAIHDRLQKNLDFVRSGGDGYAGNGSAFWRFFLKLSSCSAEFGIDSVIWSNVAKIGSLKDNPSGVLLSAQADLAECTLRAEMNEYRPVLTLFLVSGRNRGLSNIIDRALGKREWIKSEKDRRSNVLDVWWAKRTRKQSAVLWTRHPQGVRKNETAYWLARAQELMGS